MNICVKDSFYLGVADGRFPRSLPYVQRETPGKSSLSLNTMVIDLNPLQILPWLRRTTQPTHLLVTG